jgi:hypothetical protein
VAIVATSAAMKTVTLVVPATNIQDKTAVFIAAETAALDVLEDLLVMEVPEQQLWWAHWACGINTCLYNGAGCLN